MKRNSTFFFSLVLHFQSVCWDDKLLGHFIMNFFFFFLEMNLEYSPTFFRFNEMYIKKQDWFKKEAANQRKIFKIMKQAFEYKLKTWWNIICCKFSIEKWNHNTIHEIFVYSLHLIEVQLLHLKFIKPIIKHIMFLWK